MPAQPRGQDLLAHAVVELLQLDPALARPGAAFVLIKNGDHLRFPGRFGCPHDPGCRSVPLGVVVAGHPAQHPVKLPDRVKGPLLVYEVQRAYGAGECERLRLWQVTSDGFF